MPSNGIQIDHKCHKLVKYNTNRILERASPSIEVGQKLEPRRSFENRKQYSITFKTNHQINNCQYSINVSLPEKQYIANKQYVDDNSKDCFHRHATTTTTTTNWKPSSGRSQKNEMLQKTNR